MCATLAANTSAAKIHQTESEAAWAGFPPRLVRVLGNWAPAMTRMTASPNTPTM